MIAALYVQSDGAYINLPGVDPWPEERDARKYGGPWPVVAHPPCNRWINFAFLNHKRWGGEHNRPGNDNGCFESALNAVRKWGGVLEHPAGSHAWEAHGLPEPSRAGGWTRTCDQRAWVCEVWQSAYGHRARKRTWLLYCGDNPPTELDWTHKPGTHQVGNFGRKKPWLSNKEKCATPPAFRDALVAMAMHARDDGSV